MQDQDNAIHMRSKELNNGRGKLLNIKGREMLENGTLKCMERLCGIIMEVFMEHLMPSSGPASASTHC